MKFHWKYQTSPKDTSLNRHPLRPQTIKTMQILNQQHLHLSLKQLNWYRQVSSPLHSLKKYLHYLLNPRLPLILVHWSLILLPQHIWIINYPIQYQHCIVINSCPRLWVNDLMIVLSIAWCSFVALGLSLFSLIFY